MRLFVVLISLFTGVFLSAQAHYLLRADGFTDTYRLISEAGFFAETSGRQTPDEFMMHPTYRHISQTFDSQLGAHVFAFDIHVDFSEDGTLVTDGNKTELVDRQRNEIKCMDDVPGTVACDGETLTYRWKFMLPEGMKTTTEFCHIHQIKGLGSGDEVAHPVFTFTCRSTGSRQVLQIINVPYEGSPNVNLAQLDLSLFMGRWVEAVETVTVGRHGSYRLTLTDVLSGSVLLSLHKPDIEVWRDTSDRSTMRGKWGIYRSLGSGLSLKDKLRSERVLFADIEVVKGDLDGIAGCVDDNSDNDGPCFDLLGRPVAAPFRGLLIQDSKKIIFKY